MTATMTAGCLARRSERGRAPAPARPAISWRWARSKADIVGLEGEWRALEALCPNTVLFQSFAWCRNFIEFAARDSSFEPAILTLRDGGALVALFPLAIRRKAGVVLLTGLSEPFQQYSEILLHPEADRSAARTGILEAIRLLGADCMHLRQVRLDGALAGIMAETARVVGTPDRAPYVDLSAHTDFNAFFKTVNAKTRKNMRNARNRLAKTGRVQHLDAEEGELLAGVIERCHAGRKAWLARNGMTSRAFADERFLRFVCRFKEPQDAGTATLAMSLRHDGRPISDQWGFVYRGRYYAFMASFDPAYEISSPGKLHLGDVIDTCFAKGLAVADFLVPGTGYKFTWTDDAAPVSDMAVVSSWKGRLIVSMWFERGRPMAKRLFLRLPERWRTLLMKALKR